VSPYGRAVPADVARVEHLTKHYGTVKALDDVSFSVREGEVLALLGPNGAGKTTTIEILEGLRPPTAGHVTVLGVDPRRGGRRLRNRLGIVLQSAGIDANLTVAEAVRLYASFSRPRRPTPEILDQVGLDESASVRVAHLSGGQRRRLDLALALVGAPSLLFLDEPTTGLDPAARRHTWQVIESLRDQGVAIVLTSHYLDEVQHLAQRVIVLAKGRIVAHGPPASISGPTPAAATISFHRTGTAELPPGPWETVREHGGVVNLETREPVEAARILLAWSQESGTDLQGFEVRQPSLEDEYLRLTTER
jgi:ABC-2 type transport system ATP-binding protein